jgi:cellobiose PTS system EIIC component
MPFIKVMDKQYLIEESKATGKDDDDSLENLSFEGL